MWSSKCFPDPAGAAVQELRVSGGALPVVSKADMKVWIHRTIILLAVVIVLFSCHGVGTVDRAQSGLSFVGRVYVSGTDPFDRMVLISDTSGVVCVVDNFGAADELGRLAGFTVKISAMLRGRDEKGLHVFVTRYELLPPDGCMAVYGVIRKSSGGLTLELSGASRSLVLSGPLVPALKGFTGRRVWVCGELTGVGTLKSGEGAAVHEDGKEVADGGGVREEGVSTVRGTPAVCADTMLVDQYWVL